MFNASLAFWIYCSVCQFIYGNGQVVFFHSLTIFLTSGSTLCCPVPHSGPLWQWTIRFDSSSERGQKPGGNSCVQVRQKKFSCASLRWRRNEMFINFEIYLLQDNVYKEMHMFVVVHACIISTLNIRSYFHLLQDSNKHQHCYPFPFVIFRLKSSFPE